MDLEEGLTSGVAVVKSKALRIGVVGGGGVVLREEAVGKKGTKGVGGAEGLDGARRGLLGVVGGDHEGEDANEGEGGIGGGDGRSLGNGFGAGLASSSICSALSRTNSFNIRRLGFFGLEGGVGAFGEVGGRDELSV